MNRILQYSQHRLRGDTAFGTATHPTLVQVEDVIDGRVAELTYKLAEAGYATAQPVATVGTLVATYLSRAVVMGAMADIELSWPTTAQGPNQSNPRYQFYRDQWDSVAKTIGGAALEHMGATRDRAASEALHHLGASWDEQEEVDRDTDLKGAVFPRGFVEGDYRGDEADRDTAEPNA